MILHTETAPNAPALSTLIRGPANPGFDLGPALRIIILTVALLMSAALFTALFRGIFGFAPGHPATREIAVIIHVAAVVPAVPLGAFILLARKGTTLHKTLGKIWVSLMVTTALSAIFIQSGGSFSFIHIFVPLTLWSSYKLVATARRGDMKGHKKEILGLYLAALMIPGVFSMALSGRLLNAWLFW